MKTVPAICYAMLFWVRWHRFFLLFRTICSYVHMA